MVFLYTNSVLSIRNVKMFDLCMDVSPRGMRGQVDQVRKIWSLLYLVPGTCATRKTGVEGVKETDIMSDNKNTEEGSGGSWQLSPAP